MTAVAFHTTAGLNRFTGYGKLERGLVRGLYEAGVQIEGHGSLGVADFQTLPVAQQAWLKAKVTEDITDVIVTANPKFTVPAWHTMGRRVWLFTMSESNKVSREWVHAINEYCDGVMVPCPALVDVYRESGVYVPVVDVGMGVDYYDPLVLPRWERRGFNFLTYSYGDMRKGAHLAILAFKRAFGGDPKYKLWIKARSTAYNWLAGCADEQITILEGDYTESQWYELLWKADAFVFPSYGEGFGLPPREATLMRTPTIATEWLGLADIKEWGLPVRVGSMRRSQFEFEAANAKDSEWAEPDLDHLVEQMRWVANNYEEARLQADAGREYLLKRYTWAETAKRVMGVLHGDYVTATI